VTRRSRKKKAQARVRNRRRMEQAAALWRQRLPGLAVLTLVVLTLAGTAFGLHRLFDPARFPLRTLEVEGALRVLEPAGIRAVLAPLWQGQGFFTVDVQAIREAAEGMAWVREAQVRRVWPDRLVVSVREQVPVARWGRNELLNSAGERFPVAGRPVPAGLPRLAGPPGTEARVLATWRDWSARLAAVGLKARQLALDARHAWHLVLADGMRLEPGRKEAEARLARFLAAWPKVAKAAGGRRARYADLRYSNGFAVRWHDDGQEKT